MQFGGQTKGAAASQCGPMSLRQQNNEQQRQRYLGAGEEDEGRLHAYSQSGPTSGRPGSLDGSSGQHAAPAPQRPSGAYRPHVLDLRTPDPRGSFDSSRPQSIDFMGSPNARARNPVQGGGTAHWGVGAGPRDAQQTTSRYATRSPNGIQPMRAGSAPPDRRVRKYHGNRGARTVTAFDEPFQPIQREMPVQWNRAGQTQTQWDERDGPRGIRSSQGIELRYGPHGPNAPDGLQGPHDAGRRALPRSWSR